MQSFTTLIAASALLASVSASPIARRDTCGSAPAGTAGTQTPISQPTGITTAALCQAQCDTNTACLSFLFGMVNSVNECQLFSVAASSLPTQTSTNLVAYDKACTSVPTVVPTASNPTGKATTNTATTTTPNTKTGNNGHKRQAQGTHEAPLNAQPAGNPTPISTPAATSLDACLAQCKGNPACINYTFENNVCKLFGPATKKRQAQGTHANPINATPAGNPAPISTPATSNLDACLADCKGNPTCVNYTFSNNICKLFA